jgi:hypothetical protein
MSKILIDEATVKLVLDALKRMKSYGDTFGYRSHEQNPYEQVCEAITALREALAEQPAQQEPVGEVSGHDWSTGLLYRDLEPGAPLYTTPQPAQRTWVELTDEEIDAEVTQHEQAHGFIQGVEWAKAKLKEKNT